MESAAKRKAASAAVGDGEGRPAKRQKVPVCAVPNGVECIVGGGSGGASGVGRAAGRPEWRARDDWVRQVALHLRRPLLVPQQHDRRRRCIQIQRRQYNRGYWASLLTMDRLCAGRIECEH